MGVDDDDDDDDYVTKIPFILLIAGVIKYIYFAVVNCVLLAIGGNYSTDIISGATFRKIRTIHHDSGYSEVSKSFFPPQY